MIIQIITCAFTGNFRTFFAILRFHGLFQIVCEDIRIHDPTVLASHAIVDNFPGFDSVAITLHDA